MAQYKLLWRQSTSLLIVLLFSASVLISANETIPSSASARKSDHNNNLPRSHPPPPDGETNGNSLLTSRKMSDAAADKQGLLAGPMFLGLASLLFPVLPVLLLAPLAVAGAGPAMNFFQDVFGTQGNNAGAGSSTVNQGSQQAQALNNFLNNLGSSSGGDQQTSGSSISQTIQSMVGNNNGASPSGSSLSQMLAGFSSQQPSSSSSAGSSGSGSGSSLSQIAQSLGFGSDSDSERPQEGQGSGNLFGGSGSLLNTIFGPDRQSSGSGVFSGSGSIFGNLAGSGSRPIPAYASPNGNKVGQSQGQANGQSVGTSDILGAAAAALDNAGLLGPIGGGGSGSVASQIMNLVKPSSSSQSGSNGLFSSGLSELLGLGGDKATQPQTHGQLPNLGSSLSSNVVQGLHQPHTYGQAQLMNQMAGQLQSGQQSSNSPLSGLFGNADKGSSLTKLTNNALNSISNFIFSKKRSEWIPRPYAEFGYIDSASKGKLASGLSGYINNVLSTFKDGVRRYEISESECQARLICEMNQKAVGRSLKTYANTVLDLIGIESYLEKTSFGARTKNVMKDFYRAARSGMNDKDCAVMYSRCPVNIAVEPMRNSVLNNLMSKVTGQNSGYAGQSGHSGHQSNQQHHHQQHQQQQQHNHGNKHAAVYGPTIQSSGAPSAQGAQSNVQRQSSPPLAHKMSTTINRPAAAKQQPSAQSVNQVSSTNVSKVTSTSTVNKN